MVNRFAQKYDPDQQQPQQQQQQSNRFAQKYEQQSVQQQPVQQQVAPPQSSFMDGVEAFNRQFGRIAEGAIALLPGGQSAVKPVHDRLESSYNEAAQRSPKATMAGNVLGAVGAGVAYGGPSVGAASGIATKMGAGALAGGGLGYVDYADSQGERLTKGAIGASIGAVIPLAQSGISKLAEYVFSRPGTSSITERLFRPKSAAAKDVAFRMSAAVGGDVDKIKQSVQAANDLGVSLSPGQAIQGATDNAAGINYQTGADVVRAKELAMQADDVGKKNFMEFERPGYDKVSAEIKSTISDMAPEGTKELKNQLYDSLKDLTVPQEKLTDMLQNPNIQREIAKIGQFGAQADSVLPDNSLIKLDKIKRSIDSRLWNDQHALDTATRMDPTTRSGLEEARKQIVGTLDELFPDSYPVARKQAEKLIVQKQYNELIGKIKSKSGSSPTLDEVHSALFGNKEKTQLFLQDVAKTGGDTERAQQVLNVANQLYKSTLGQAAKRVEDGAGSTFRMYGRDIGVVQSIAEKLTGQRYAKALQDFTLTKDNKWADKVTEILSREGAAAKEKGLLGLFGEYAGQGVKNAASVSAARKYGIEN